MYFDHLADPREVFREIFLLVAAQFQLILPVRRDAVFRRVVHLVGTDLHLKGDTVLAEHDRVQALVHIRLGGRDIILEAVRQRRVDIMHQSEDVVAVRDGVDDHAHGKDVKDLVDIAPLHIGLAVDGNDRFDPAGDRDMRDRVADLIHDLFLDLFDKHVALIFGELQLFFDLAVGDGIQIAHGQILELILDRLHT